MTRHFPNLRTAGCIAVLGLLWCTTALAQDFSAQAAVDTDSVTLGEPLQFQIQVSGSDAPEEPDTSAITEFTVTLTGRGNNSTSSVSIINGRMTQDVRKGYLFNYQLVPKRIGTLTIPPITVKDGANTTATQPVSITVGAAQESDDFKLRMQLAKSEIWAGESVELDFTFYFKASLEQPQLRLPIADRPGFAVREVEIANGQDTEMLDGKEYQIIKARRILIPQNPGHYPLEPATLSFRAVAGYRVQQDRFFGRQQVPNYRNFVIPSNPLELTVRELPTQGRPPGFSGHVGSFKITSTASPTTVNVGDPITLTITLSGPSYLQGIDLPPLQKQAELATNFRLPAERSPGQVQGDSLRFTQTIRVARSGAGPFSLDRDLLKRIPGLQKLCPWLFAVLPIALILLPPATARAASSPADSAELFHQANALFRQANEQSATDPKAASETYAKAILRFEQIIREGGIENGKLYYNIGNAYFRTRDIGRAIANYRRAQDLIPHDANVAQNLEFARSRRADRIEVPARQKVAQSLFFWHYDLTARTKATLLTWFVLIGWGAAAGRLFYPRPSLVWIAGSGGVLAVLFLGSLMLDARAEATVREGVIIAPEVVARKGDSETYEPSFKEPLHAGTEFRIREQREGWTQAELGDGRTCWLPEKAFERIW